MISKPLFKQSVKANFGIWAFVAFITCFMLATVILVLGNFHIGSIRDSMMDLFVEDAIESTLQDQSMTYYNMTNNALVNYDENVENFTSFAEAYKQTRVEIYESYPNISSQSADEQARAYIKTSLELDEKGVAAFDFFIDYCLTKEGQIDYSDFSYESSDKASKYTLDNISSAIYRQLLLTEGIETAERAKSFITTAINSYVAVNEENPTTAVDFSKDFIPNILSSVFIDTQFPYSDGSVIRVDSYFTKQELYDISHDAIIVFNARIEDYAAAGHTDEEIKARALEIINENKGSMFENLPEDVTSSLTEISNMDVFGMVIGSIFYRIAGLLLPIIYVIMAANNLISNQVDKGSMAYILSTPIKRRKVMITQMLYMISSLFVMFALTTITSLTCFAIIDTSRFVLTLGHIALFNLGAFITMLAISGICFLTSAWFNRSKLSTSVGGGISMFFLVATILGLFGSKIMPSAVRIDAMNYFNYVSIISLFDTTSITSGTFDYLWKWAILIVIALVTYTIGIIKFKKKDLPL